MNRVEEFPTGSEPVEVTVATGPGRIEVRLTDEPGVRVTVRHAPESANPWTEGIASLVTWFSGQLADQPDLPGEAVRRTRVEFAAGRLVVRAPKEPHLRAVPIAVSVQAPTGSAVSARGGPAAVTVTGVAGRVEAFTGGGAVDIAEATGPVQATSATGTVRVGPAPAGVRARTGGGDVELTAVGGTTNVVTGAGDVWVGAVSGDVLVRTGTGDITVADAAAGQLDLTTGSGALRVAVRPGAPAEIDVSSGSGEARADLPLTDQPPQTAPPLRVRGRTGSGNALVTTATR
ncbi:DUF4097 family beta strand repeat-containing protein [Actinokineospora iranica]|uniref:DUF4097 domain-containing protein n=1 Tax=Actinokineospora iranica TaxID=1271860 RepID=A0A1G6KIV4_9PSEU|nr:hypothetical protein [Actinokineospora iranica]SDC31042.1 hypothetical protein SAMN05216174_101943 [Actinokineospora iranica]